MHNLLTEFHQTEPYYPSEGELQQVATEFDPLQYHFFETMNPQWVTHLLHTDSSVQAPPEFNPSAVMRPGTLITMIFH